MLPGRPKRGSHLLEWPAFEAFGSPVPQLPLSPSSPTSPLRSLFFSHRGSAWWEPTPWACLRWVPSPSSPVKQMKPNGQHLADGQWVSIKGTHNLCFSWNVTGSEEATPSLEKGSHTFLPPSKPPGSVGSYPLRRRRQWHPTPVLLPGKSHGRRSLVSCSPWGCKELDTTEWLHFHFSFSCIGKGNGNPLVFLPGESQRWGAWWAAVSGVSQSRTRLKRLSSSMN